MPPTPGFHLRAGLRGGVATPAAKACPLLSTLGLSGRQTQEAIRKQVQAALSQSLGSPGCLSLPVTWHMSSSSQKMAPAHPPVRCLTPSRLCSVPSSPARAPWSSVPPALLPRSPRHGAPPRMSDRSKERGDSRAGPGTRTRRGHSGERVDGGCANGEDSSVLKGGQSSGDAKKEEDSIRNVPQEGQTIPAATRATTTHCSSGSRQAMRHLI